MASAPSPEELRAMAEHRGFKLVRSRKRTPGVGDYGRFGLTDTAGQPIVGIGAEGLTASAAEIADYLRTGAVSSWKQSAAAPPDRLPAKKARPAPPPPEDEAPIRRRGKSAPAPKARAMRVDPPPPPREPPVLRIVPKGDPQPDPPPTLKLRAATPADTQQLAALLGQLKEPPDDDAIAANLAGLKKAKAGLVVAELGDIVGCASWAVVPTIQRGPVGRLTLLLVDRDHRRRGVGRALVVHAEQSLAKSGCTEVEVMSDIAVANAHNFFRSLAFEQKSYRFVRPVRQG